MDRPPTAMEPGLVVEREPAAGDGPRWVVAQAEAELVRRYGALHHSERGLVPAMFDPPGGAFVVARTAQAARPLGGVGVRRTEADPGHTGEVRRLWVDPTWRGRGVGRARIDALEEAARRLGLGALVLSTGDRQPEAASLYRSAGWARLAHDADGAPLAASHLRFAKSLGTGEGEAGA